MKTIKNKKTQTFPKNSATLEGMDLYSLCRWASLKDAIDLVGEKCEEKHIDFENFDLKPLDLLKYVDSMTDELYNKALRQEPIV
jgi:hypothetical protein